MDVYIHYVRTGQYKFANNRMLTQLGHKQVAMAAADVAKRIGKNDFVVFKDMTAHPAYQQTANIIARALGVQTVKSVFFDDFHDYHLTSISDYVHKGVNHFVLVVNGSSIEDMIGKYPGPAIECDGFGPPNGSVQTLRVRATTTRYDGKIIVKNFI